MCSITLKLRRNYGALRTHFEAQLRAIAQKVSEMPYFTTIAAQQAHFVALAPQ
jgi:hypothetical protein